METWFNTLSAFVRIKIVIWDRTRFHEIPLVYAPFMFLGDVNDDCDGDIVVGGIKTCMYFSIYLREECLKIPIETVCKKLQLKKMNFIGVIRHCKLPKSEKSKQT